MTGARVGTDNRRKMLGYLRKKVSSLKNHALFLEEAQARSELITEVLVWLWRRADFIDLLQRLGMAKRPQLLDSASFDSVLEKPGPLIPEDPQNGPTSAEDYLRKHEAPRRAHNALETLTQPRQQQVARLLIECNDFSQTFIGALVAATPLDQRVLTNKPGARSSSLQKDLAVEEFALRRWRTREQDALRYTKKNAISFVIATGYLRYLLSEPAVTQWLKLNEAAMMDALSDFEAANAMIFSKFSRQDAPGVF